MTHKFRKKPVVIEAYCFNQIKSNFRPDWFQSAVSDNSIFTYEDRAVVKTLEGDMTAALGDWIIKGVEGELYPCKPSVFAATYEPVLEFQEKDCAVNVSSIDLDLAMETLINTRHPYGAFHYLEQAAAPFGLDASQIDSLLKSAIALCIADVDARGTPEGVAFEAKDAAVRACVE